MTSHGPRFYTNHLSLSFISLIEMVSSGSFYAVFIAPRLFAPPPPGCCATQTEGEGPRTPPVALQTKRSDAHQVPSTARFYEVLVSSHSHDVPLYFAFILWYYTLL